MAPAIAYNVAGCSGYGVLRGSSSIASIDGNDRYRRREARSAVAAAGRTVLAIAVVRIDVDAICMLRIFATWYHVRGTGLLLRSFVALNGESRSGRTRRNAINSAGKSFAIAQLHQSSKSVVSSTIDPKRDFTGSKIPLTPA